MTAVADQVKVDEDWPPKALVASTDYVNSEPDNFMRCIIEIGSGLADNWSAILFYDESHNRFVIYHATDTRHPDLPHDPPECLYEEGVILGRGNRVIVHPAQRPGKMLGVIAVRAGRIRGYKVLVVDAGQVEVVRGSPPVREQEQIPEGVPVFLVGSMPEES